MKRRQSLDVSQVISVVLLLAGGAIGSLTLATLDDLMKLNPHLLEEVSGRSIAARLAGGIVVSMFLLLASISCALLSICSAIRSRNELTAASERRTVGTGMEPVD